MDGAVAVPQPPSTMAKQHEERYNKQHDKRHEEKEAEDGVLALAGSLETLQLEQQAAGLSTSAPKEPTLSDPVHPASAEGHSAVPEQPSWQGEARQAESQCTHRAAGISSKGGPLAALWQQGGGVAMPPWEGVWGCESPTGTTPGVWDP